MRRGYIHPYTPEMNPIEQIWREFRRIGLRNEVFEALDKVVVIILVVKNNTLSLLHLFSDLMDLNLRLFIVTRSVTNFHV